LEAALNAYFERVGYRNLQEVVDIIKEAGTTWRSSAQAVWLEI